MKNLSGKTLAFAILSSVIVPAVSFAHTGVGTLAGFGDGLGHPLLGADHVLAMLAVGILAFQNGGRGAWAIPATFVGMMLVGGASGFYGIRLPYVDQGIFASLLVFGILIAAAVRVPVLTGAMVAGVFALFHGHSHGTEVPALATGLYYAAGFAVSTAVLHAAGYASALGVKKALGDERLVRYSGLAIAAVGAILFI